MMTMSVTAGADAHAAAVTAEADLAVLHTNAARTDQEAPETLVHTADTGGAEVVRITDTGHVITAADATDQPRALHPATPNTSPRAGAPGPDRPARRGKSCKRRPDPVRKSPASVPPPARRPVPARAPDPGPGASLEAASQRSAFKYCIVQLFIQSLFNHDGAAASACSRSYWIPNKRCDLLES